MSKAPAGTRVIKVVYKVNKGSFDIHYRLKDSDKELTTADVDNNEGKEYDVSFVNTFEAKENRRLPRNHSTLRSQHPAQGV